jgi:hypothetical protein
LMSRAGSGMAESVVPKGLLRFLWFQIAAPAVVGVKTTTWPGDTQKGAWGDRGGVGR